VKSLDKKLRRIRAGKYTGTDFIIDMAFGITCPGPDGKGKWQPRANYLRGAAGTTRDTFELALQAENSGARVALFGRKINLAEAPVKLVSLIRDTIDQALTPSDAVHAYHDHLKQCAITPLRTLKNDLTITEEVLKN